MSFRVWALTHAGTVRKHNEDTLVSRPEIGMWAVADGAGGHESGELASGMLAEALLAIPASAPPAELEADMRQRVAAVHVALQKEAASRGHGGLIASTIVILTLRDSRYTCLWAGDSRLYMLRAGTLTQISRDHSLVQELVDSGAIPASQAESHPQANVITRAVGSLDTAIELDCVSGALQPGDRFLLCSDGLSKALPAPMLTKLVAEDADEGPAWALVAAALEHGARDNVTAVVVQPNGDAGAARA
jgi:protein phosphatase/serine/threonine-protein phosphatase Stp1